MSELSEDRGSAQPRLGGRLGPVLQVGHEQNSSIIAPLPFIFVAFHRLKLIRASVCTFFDLSQINFLKLCNDLLMMKVVLFPSFLHYTPSSPKIQKNPPQTGLNRNDCNKYCSCSLWLRLRLFLGPRLLA